MADGTTLIVNETKGDLKIKIGNNHRFADLTTVEKGAMYAVQVHFNATYHEYFMGVDAAGKKLIVSTDDCCDYKSITIQEVGGKFDVRKEPRKASSPITATTKPAAKKLTGLDLHREVPMAAKRDQTETNTADVKKSRFSWRFWRQIWPGRNSL